jgi:diguanylate cyclase (GGDEF)-like protein
VQTASLPTLGAVKPPLCSEPERLLLEDLVRRQPLLALINALMALLTAWVMVGPGSYTITIGWLAILLAAQAGRVCLWNRLRGTRDPNATARLGAPLTIAAAATGLAWGSAGLLLGQHADPVAEMFVPFVLGGMAAGSIAALPAHPPAFFLFIWSALLPYALRQAITANPTAHAMAAATVLYALGLSAVGTQVYRTLRRAAELHLQNTSLARRLEEAKQGLEATVKQRTAELLATNAALSHEIGERRRTEERVRHLLAHDPLTNLPNRLLLFDRLRQAVAASRRSGRKTAVLVFDLDRFKDINDGHGHPVGDRLLRELALRIRETVRATDTLARIGGDEFALVVPDLADAQLLHGMAQRLVEACRAPFALGESRLQISISVGAAFFPDHGDDLDGLLRAADTALYSAKTAGRDRLVVYSTALHAVQRHRRRLQAELVQAPARGQFRLAYQPRFALADRRLMAVEALLRWDHPEFGKLPTDRFIAVAEASGLIVDIGRWVLDTACEQGRRWRDAGHPVRVAVNLSAVEFRQASLPDRVRESLVRADLDPSLLELEITETACMEREGAGQDSAVEEIKKLGVGLAIDDFGTGYSSLAYLKWLPFDVLKVDRSFIRNLTGDPRDEAIVTTIVTLARQLEKTVVAEGVETEQQLETLDRLGCHEAQGFLLGRPSPPETIEEMLAA